jgi:hypothetical protein
VRRWIGAAAIVLALAGCQNSAQRPACAVCAANKGPTELSQHWLLGMNPMAGDPELLHPFTNRFMADLGGMPGVRAIDLAPSWNAHLFRTSPDDRIEVSTVLHGGGNCMEITYTVYRHGTEHGRFGQVVTPLYAGPEPDGACVDRAATQLYLTLVRAGL